jgi:type I restriction enzyme, S subunit
MTNVNQLITDHLDIWTTATEKKSNAGRGNGRAVGFYGIAKLRELIFNLAADGRLVRPEEATEKSKLGEHVELVMGQAPPGSECNKDGVGTVFVKNGEFGRLYPEVVEWTTKPLKLALKGDVLICVVGATIGKLNLAIDCAIGRSVAAIRPKSQIETRFLYYSLMPYTLRLRGGARGSAQGVIGKTELNAVEIRVPPLAEQNRIVAKVDELMALCDALERQAEDSLKAHQTLVETCLATLTNSQSPEDLTQNWTRIEAHFDTLFTTEESIQTLEAAIVELGVTGLLVPQSEADEPATQLLQRVAEDIAAYSKLNRVRPVKPTKITEQESQAERLPSGWVETRLSSLFRVVTDGDHQAPPRASEGIAFLTIGNISSGQLNFDGCRRVPDDYYKGLPAYRTPGLGDILYTVVGATYGRPVLVETDEKFCVQRHIAILKPSHELDVDYLVWMLKSAWVYNQAREGITGSAQPTLALKPLRNFLVLLPPRAQQERISKKIKQLHNLTARLRETISISTETQVSLAETLTSKIH